MNQSNWGGKRENAGRKKGRKTGGITLNLPTEQIKELRYRAKLAHLTPAQFISKYLNLSLITYTEEERISYPNDIALVAEDHAYTYSIDKEITYPKEKEQ